jgi:hypothetical protein
MGHKKPGLSNTLQISVRSQFHNHLGEERHEFREKIEALDREFHEQPHEAWEEERFRHDLHELRRDFEEALQRAHYEYHEGD